MFFRRICNYGFRLYPDIIMAVCFPWGMVQQIVPRNLTSFIDGFTTEFGLAERFTNNVKNSHLLEQGPFFQSKVR